MITVDRLSELAVLVGGSFIKKAKHVFRWAFAKKNRQRILMMCETKGNFIGELSLEEYGGVIEGG